MIVVACNRKTCHTATGGGRLPIVNVPFSLGRKAAGAHGAVDGAVCSRGYRCARAQAGGVVTPAFRRGTTQIGTPPPRLTIFIVNCEFTRARPGSSASLFM